MKSRKTLVISIIIYILVIIIFVGCKKTTLPDIPDGNNSEIELSLQYISSNYLGKILFFHYNISDLENDDQSGEIIYKILVTSGSLGIINGSISNEITTNKGYTVKIKGPPYWDSQVVTNENLFETGPFSIKIVAYDPVHNNTGTLIIDSLIEEYETTAKVFFDVTNQEIRISNEDYDQWSTGIDENYFGGDPEEWQKNAASTTDINTVKNNYNADPEKSVTRTYNSLKDFETFDNEIKGEPTGINFIRHKY